MNKNDDETGRERFEIDGIVTLSEIAHETTNRMVNERIEHMDKQMESLAMLMEELRKGQIRLNEMNSTRKRYALESNSMRRAPEMPAGATPISQ